MHKLFTYGAAAWGGAALTAACLLLAGATPKPPPASRPIEVDGADWRARSMAWFVSADTAERRTEMRSAGQALKQACRYCHTPDFKDYTDKQAISRQMMALSAEHGVTCAECHSGRETFTELGERSREMWTLALEKKVFCDHCHVTKTKFEKLTPEGETYRKAHAKP